MKEPRVIRQMPEPMRTLLLQGIKSAGNYRPEEVLSSVEEQMTGEERQEAQEFLDWVQKNGLTLGHGTINLRYHEFRRKLKPMSKDDAYNWALERMKV